MKKAKKSRVRIAPRPTSPSRPEKPAERQSLREFFGKMSKEEYKEFIDATRVFEEIETSEVLSDPATMQQIRRSKAYFRRGGRGKSIDEVFK